MADLYSYDNVVVTRLLEDSVRHLLSEEVKKSVSEVLITKLEEWEESDRGIDVLSNDVSLEVVDNDDSYLKIMPFKLVQQIQEQLKITPQYNQTPPYISDLLNGSRIVFPSYSPPPRNPDLVARLERIQIDLENKQYNKMVGRINMDTPDVLQDIRIDSQETHRQLWMVVNFLLTVIGSFVFGYFAALYAGFELLWCYMTGLIIGLAVFFADLYFIAKNL